MSDITLIFGFLLILGVGLTGLLTTWWLLFPKLVGRARLRVAHTPWKTFAMGIVGLILWVIPISVLFALPGGPTRLLAGIGIATALTFATIGAAGIAAHMGDRLADSSRPNLAPSTAFLRGSTAFVLSAGVPVLGWFIVVPLALVESMGAAIFALLHWAPSQAKTVVE